MAAPQTTPSFASSVVYQEPLKMFEWLETAFGFEPYFLITDKDGNLAHAQMSFGNGLVMVGYVWNDDYASPAALGGKNTQSVRVQLAEGIEEHCARARAAGAEIIQPPESQFYGEKTYRAKDPEGHVWTFSQFERDVPKEEWETAMGLKGKTFE